VSERSPSVMSWVVGSSTTLSQEDRVASPSLLLWPVVSVKQDGDDLILELFECRVRRRKQPCAWGSPVR
jgi:hypothetical protein